MSVIYDISKLDKGKIFDITEFEKIDNVANYTSKSVSDLKKDVFDYCMQHSYVIPENQANTYILKYDKLPSGSKKISITDKDQANWFIQRCYNIITYIMHKYGTMKYGPVLYCGKSGKEEFFVDFSNYILKGNKNVLNYVFHEEISELCEKIDSNFIENCKKNFVYVPKDELKYMFNKGSALLKEKSQKILFKKDYDALFKYLVDTDKDKEKKFNKPSLLHYRLIKSDKRDDFIKSNCDYNQIDKDKDLID